MSFYRRTGELIFGTRLKRISDKFLMDIARVYKSLNINFEISWFPLFYLLKEKGELSITAIANELKITHSAVSQLVNTLEKKELIKFLNDKNDRRKRLIYFTPKGLTLLNTVIPVWQSMKRAIQQLFSERENSCYLLLALNELEESIEKKSIYSRVMCDVKKTQFGNIEVIPYHSECQSQFKNLILTWLIDNYDTEVPDVDLINEPERKIREGGCIILMAKAKDKFVGTIIALMKERTKSEIIYIVVDERWQKRQIGKKLLLEAIKQLEQRGVKNIYIKLDQKFSHAIKLFKREGFVLRALKLDEGISKLKRTRLLMERNLALSKQ